MVTAKEAAAAVADMSIEELELVDDERATVQKAIATRRKALTEQPRVFVLVDGINSYSFGANPHYVVAAGDRLETTDRRLAARLVADGHLTEVTP